MNYFSPQQNFRFECHTRFFAFNGRSLAMANKLFTNLCGICEFPPTYIPYRATCCIKYPTACAIPIQTYHVPLMLTMTQAWFIDFTWLAFGCVFWFNFVCKIANSSSIILSSATTMQPSLTKSVSLTMYNTIVEKIVRIKVNEIAQAHE